MKKFCDVCFCEVNCKYHEENITEFVDGIEIEYLEKFYICNECNSKFYDDLGDYNIHEANKKLREHTNLITSKEIEEILNKYDIGKKPLSLLLGFGEIQIIRYLKSGNPSKEHSDILRSIKDNPFIFEGYIYANKDRVSNIAFKKALGKAKQLELTNEHSKIYQISTYLLKKYEDTTDLALQKILYFLNGFSEKFLGEYLFLEKAEAWKHGPVYRELYDAFSYYERANIDYSELITNHEFNLTPKEVEYIDKILPFFACYSGSVLRNMSHLTDPWIKARVGLEDDEYSNHVIDKRDIKEYFDRICEEYNINSIEDVYNYSQDLLNKTINIINN